MLISDMVSMLAISRLIPTVTGPSEEEKNTQQHALHSLQSDSTANRERQQKRFLIYMRYKSGLHQLKPEAFPLSLHLF